MGYKVPKREAELTLEEHPGLKVLCSLDQELGVFFEYQRMAGSEDPDKVEAALRQFGDNTLLSWNVENDDGTPKPASADGFMTLPLPFATQIINGWVAAVKKLAAPLVEPSENGTESKEDSNTDSPSPALAST